MMMLIKSKNETAIKATHKKVIEEAIRLFQLTGRNTYSVPRSKVYCEVMKTEDGFTGSVRKKVKHMEWTFSKSLAEFVATQKAGA